MNVTDISTPHDTENWNCILRLEAVTPRDLATLRKMIRDTCPRLIIYGRNKIIIEVLVMHQLEIEPTVLTEGQSLLGFGSPPSNHPVQ